MNWSKFFFTLGTAICLPFMTYFRFFNIDPSTGFFTDKGALTIFYYTILTACVLGPVVFSLWGKRLPEPVFLSGNRLLAIPAVGLGLLSLWQGAAKGWTYLSYVLSFTDVSDVLWSEPLPLLLNIIQLLVALAGAAGFFLLAFHFAVGSKKNISSLILFGIPIWFGVLCAQIFMDYPQISSFPDRALWFTCLVLFTMFLVGHSRILYGADPQKGQRYLWGFGSGCALCGTVLTLSTVLSLHLGATLPLAHFLFAAFAACYVVFCLFFPVNKGRHTNQ